MAAVVNVNGRICSEQEAVISVFDHGFVYGEGVYEVVRTYHRQLFRYDAHMRRLRESAARIALDVPVSNDDMLARIRQTMAALPDPPEVYNRVLVTRGVGDLGIDPRSCPKPSVICIVTDIRVYPPPTNVPGQGVGVIEAPRGTLFHDYSTDENGLLTRVNLIVATGNNNWAMHTASGLVAKAFVDGNKLTEGMLNRVEAAIRCYDPCLSCSTHAIGKMPLEITLVAADGTVLDRISRS